MANRQAVRADAKSPYAKYGKVPFRYSDAYRAWRELVLKGSDPEDIAAADIRHRKAFGIPLPVGV